MTFVRDVAHVHDGFEVQPNIVRADGKRAVLLQILKNGHSSTLDIIKAVKAKLPALQAAWQKVNGQAVMDLLAVLRIGMTTRPFGCTSGWPPLTPAAGTIDCDHVKPPSRE